MERRNKTKSLMKRKEKRKRPTGKRRRTTQHPPSIIYHLQVEHTLIQPCSPRIPLQSRSVLSPDCLLPAIIIKLRLRPRHRQLAFENGLHVAAQSCAEDVGVAGWCADREGFGSSRACKADLVRLGVYGVSHVVGMGWEWEIMRF